MAIWIVGRAHADRWEIVGAFPDERMAVSRCCTQNDFVARLEPGEECPDELDNWSNLRYPCARQRA